MHKRLHNINGTHLCPKLYIPHPVNDFQFLVAPQIKRFWILYIEKHEMCGARMSPLSSLSALQLPAIPLLSGTQTTILTN